MRTCACISSSTAQNIFPPPSLPFDSHLPVILRPYARTTLSLWLYLTHPAVGFNLPLSYLFQPWCPHALQLWDVRVKPHDIAVSPLTDPTDTAQSQISPSVFSPHICSRPGCTDCLFYLEYYLILTHTCVCEYQQYIPRSKRTLKQEQKQKQEHQVVSRADTQENVLLDVKSMTVPTPTSSISPHHEQQQQQQQVIYLEDIDVPFYIDYSPTFSLVLPPTISKTFQSHLLSQSSQHSSFLHSPPPPPSKHKLGGADGTTTTTVVSFSTPGAIAPHIHSPSTVVVHDLTHPPSSPNLRSPVQSQNLSSPAPLKHSHQLKTTPSVFNEPVPSAFLSPQACPQHWFRSPNWPTAFQLSDESIITALNTILKPVIYTANKLRYQYVALSHLDTIYYSVPWMHLIRRIGVSLFKHLLFFTTMIFWSRGGGVVISGLYSDEISPVWSTQSQQQRQQQQQALVVKQLTETNTIKTPSLSNADPTPPTLSRSPLTTHQSAQNNSRQALNQSLFGTTSHQMYLRWKLYHIQFSNQLMISPNYSSSTEFRNLFHFIQSHFAPHPPLSNMIPKYQLKRSMFQMLCNAIAKPAVVQNDMEYDAITAPRPEIATSPNAAANDIPGQTIFSFYDSSQLSEDQLSQGTLFCSETVAPSQTSDSVSSAPASPLHHSPHQDNSRILSIPQDSSLSTTAAPPISTIPIKTETTAAPPPALHPSTKPPSIPFLHCQFICFHPSFQPFLSSSHQIPLYFHSFPKTFSASNFVYQLFPFEPAGIIYGLYLFPFPEVPDSSPPLVNASLPRMPRALKPESVIPPSSITNQPQKPLKWLQNRVLPTAALYQEHRKPLSYDGARFRFCEMLFSVFNTAKAFLLRQMYPNLGLPAHVINATKGSQSQSHSQNHSQIESFFSQSSTTGFHQTHEYTSHKLGKTSSFASIDMTQYSQSRHPTNTRHQQHRYHQIKNKSIPIVAFERSILHKIEKKMSQLKNAQRTHKQLHYFGSTQTVFQDTIQHGSAQGTYHHQSSQLKEVQQQQQQQQQQEQRKNDMVSFKNINLSANVPTSIVANDDASNTNVQQQQQRQQYSSLDSTPFSQLSQLSTASTSQSTSSRFSSSLYNRRRRLQPLEQNVETIDSIAELAQFQPLSTKRPKYTITTNSSSEQPQELANATPLLSCEVDGPVHNVRKDFLPVPDGDETDTIETQMDDIDMSSTSSSLPKRKLTSNSYSFDFQQMSSTNSTHDHDMDDQSFSMDHIESVSQHFAMNSLSSQTTQIFADEAQNLHRKKKQFHQPHRDSKFKVVFYRRSIPSVPMNENQHNSEQCAPTLQFCAHYTMPVDCQPFMKQPHKLFMFQFPPIAIKELLPSSILPRIAKYFMYKSPPSAAVVHQYSHSQSGTSSLISQHNTHDNDTNNNTPNFTKRPNNNVFVSVPPRSTLTAFPPGYFLTTIPLCLELDHDSKPNNKKRQTNSNAQTKAQTKRQPQLQSQTLDSDDEDTNMTTPSNNNQAALRMKLCSFQPWTHVLVAFIFNSVCALTYVEPNLRHLIPYSDTLGNFIPAKTPSTSATDSSDSTEDQGHTPIIPEHHPYSSTTDNKHLLTPFFSVSSHQELPRLFFLSLRCRLRTCIIPHGSNMHQINPCPYVIPEYLSNSSNPPILSMRCITSLLPLLSQFIFLLHSTHFEALRVEHIVTPALHDPAIIERQYSIRFNPLTPNTIHHRQTNNIDESDDIVDHNDENDSDQGDDELSSLIGAQTSPYLPNNPFDKSCHLSLQSIDIFDPDSGVLLDLTSNAYKSQDTGAIQQATQEKARQIFVRLARMDTPTEEIESYLNAILHQILPFGLFGSHHNKSLIIQHLITFSLSKSAIPLDQFSFLTRLQFKAITWLPQDQSIPSSSSSLTTAATTTTTTTTRPLPHKNQVSKRKTTCSPNLQQRHHVIIAHVFSFLLYQVVLPHLQTLFHRCPQQDGPDSFYAFRVWNNVLRFAHIDIIQYFNEEPRANQHIKEQLVSAAKKLVLTAQPLMQHPAFVQPKQEDNPLSPAAISAASFTNTNQDKPHHHVSSETATTTVRRFASTTQSTAQVSKSSSLPMRSVSATISTTSQVMNSSSSRSSVVLHRNPTGPELSPPSRQFTPLVRANSKLAVSLFSSIPIAWDTHLAKMKLVLKSSGVRYIVNQSYRKYWVDFTHEVYHAMAKAFVAQQSPSSSNQTDSSAFAREDNYEESSHHTINQTDPPQAQRIVLSTINFAYRQFVSVLRESIRTYHHKSLFSAYGLSPSIAYENHFHLLMKSMQISDQQSVVPCPLNSNDNIKSHHIAPSTVVTTSHHFLNQMARFTSMPTLYGAACLTPKQLHDRLYSHLLSYSHCIQTLVNPHLNLPACVHHTNQQLNQQQQSNSQHHISHDNINSSLFITTSHNISPLTRVVTMSQTQHPPQLFDIEIQSLPATINPQFPPVFALTLDITKCYDNIDTSLLHTILCPILNHQALPSLSTPTTASKSTHDRSSPLSYFSPRQLGAQLSCTMVAKAQIVHNKEQYSTEAIGLWTSPNFGSTNTISPESPSCSFLHSHPLIARTFEFTSGSVLDSLSFPSVMSICENHHPSLNTTSSSGSSLPSKKPSLYAPRRLPVVESKDVSLSPSPASAPSHPVISHASTARGLTFLRCLIYKPMPPNPKLTGFSYSTAYLLERLRSLFTRVFIQLNQCMPIGDTHQRGNQRQGLFFTQTRGISQGSCLSPMFANLFLAHIERETWQALRHYNYSSSCQCSPGLTAKLTSAMSSSPFHRPTSLLQRYFQHQYNTVLASSNSIQLKKPISLFWNVGVFRKMDDFLLLIYPTVFAKDLSFTDVQHALSFITCLIHSLSLFGLEIKPEKTKANFAMTLHPASTQSAQISFSSHKISHTPGSLGISPQRDLIWNGLSFNTVSLHLHNSFSAFVSHPYSSLSLPSAYSLTKRYQQTTQAKFYDATRSESDYNSTSKTMSWVEQLLHRQFYPKLKYPVISLILNGVQDVLGNLYQTAYVCCVRLLLGMKFMYMRNDHITEQSSKRHSFQQHHIGNNRRRYSSNKPLLSLKHHPNNSTHQNNSKDYQKMHWPHFSSEVISSFQSFVSTSCHWIENSIPQSCIDAPYATNAVSPSSQGIPNDPPQHHAQHFLHQTSHKPTLSAPPPIIPPCKSRKSSFPLSNDSTLRTFMQTSEHHSVQPVRTHTPFFFFNTPHHFLSYQQQESNFDNDEHHPVAPTNVTSLPSHFDETSIISFLLRQLPDCIALMVFVAAFDVFVRYCSPHFEMDEIITNQLSQSNNRVCSNILSVIFTQMATPSAISPSSPTASSTAAVPPTSMKSKAPQPTTKTSSFISTINAILEKIKNILKNIVHKCIPFNQPPSIDPGPIQRAPQSAQLVQTLSFIQQQFSRAFSNLNVDI